MDKPIKKKSPHKGTAGFLARREAAKITTPTSWGGVAGWYHDTVEDKGSYQKDLILPNLLRLMDVKNEEVILDLACGEGFFSRRLAKLGARVIGSDIAPELIAIAKRDPSFAKASEGELLQYFVAPADRLSFLKDNSIDKVAIVLAIQNIENVKGMLEEVKRVLKSKGKLYLVINHPAFRVPKESSWGFDEALKTQYRRIDKYLSESRTKIQMHPGDKPDELTLSFHRPLQFYFKQLGKAGFGVTNMEEWSSNRLSQPGPRAEAENRSRKEIPLFMCIEAVKI